MKAYLINLFVWLFFANVRSASAQCAINRRFVSFSTLNLYVEREEVHKFIQNLWLKKRKKLVLFVVFRFNFHSQIFICWSYLFSYYFVRIIKLFHCLLSHSKPIIKTDCKKQRTSEHNSTSTHRTCVRICVESLIFFCFDNLFRISPHRISIYFIFFFSSPKKGKKVKLVWFCCFITSSRGIHVFSNQKNVWKTLLFKISKLANEEEISNYRPKCI